MIPKECKRLAEVDFPIAEVSKHSAREKSIRHGHPSTLHLWWARRPLAACRAMLLGLLLPDPCDEHCPEDFKKEARELLPRVGCLFGNTDEDVRKGLLKFIGDFANWDLSSDRTFLEVSRGLVKAAHPEETPLVVDPFAGGGSIPLEALRLGCEAFASDLNPVACLILKVMLEDIPRESRRRGAENAESLADELRRVGKEIKENAERELKEFYPVDSDGGKPIAYLWARTVRCESPNCGAEIPLMRSFWLCKKANRKKALRYKIHRRDGENAEVEFEIFEPKTEKEIPEGTVTRAKATCLCCNVVLPPERVRAQLSLQKGGADVIFEEIHRRDTESAEDCSVIPAKHVPAWFKQGAGIQSSPRLGGKVFPWHRIGGARLLAVVTLTPRQQGRHYRLPTPQDYEAVWKAQKRLKEILTEWEKGGKKGLCPVPDEPMNTQDPTTIAGRGYGLKKWEEIFTARQLHMLRLLSNEVLSLTKSSIQLCLSLALDRTANALTSLSRWHTSGEKLEGALGRQALPMVWDFCEGNPFSDATGGFDGAIDWVARVVKSLPIMFCGQVQLANAADSPLPDSAAHVWFTDPPYYDAIAYANLSDFFFVWLKRALPENSLQRDSFDPTNLLTPKALEAVQNEESCDSEGYPKDRLFYEKVMAISFAQGRRVLKEDGVGSVVFAHKTTEGWEALLSGMIRGGWTITGSWPIATEMGARLNARETAALATSVHLVCRPRPDDAPVGDWADVLRELPNRVGDWMERLQNEGVRGADLVFACIGPALEIFSRYTKVETAEGREILLAEYLEKVWEVVGRMALEQVLGTAEAKARNGAAGAVEEDARLTALFLWTMQSTNHTDAIAAEKNENNEDASDEDDEDTSSKGKTKGFSLVYDVVRRFSQPLGINLPDWEGHIIEIEKGVVRLLSLQERAKILFGESNARAVAEHIEKSKGDVPQLSLFSDVEEGAAPQIKGGRGKKKKGKAKISEEDIQKRREATTLDRVHAAMLLQSGGQTNALRALLKAEGERGADFLRLANALSALYHKVDSKCEEKRLLDAMLLAMPK